MVSKTTGAGQELSHDLLIEDKIVRRVSINGLQPRMPVLHGTSFPTEPQHQNSQLVNNTQAESPFRDQTTTLQSIDRSSNPLYRPC